ncbi:MAG: phosphoenolpyruvate--protein phosphotransferase [Phycisphaerales bacterium]|nr:phosphoenolpyruvate--protein phosphotransferase [Phycisphaerales bacterium]
MPAMKIIKGIKVASGIAIGRAFVIDDAYLPHVPRRSISAEEMPSELDRFENARRLAIEELNSVHAEARQEMGDESAKIFLFHIGMLNDPALLKPIRDRIERELLTPEFAAAETFRHWIARFSAKENTAFQTKVNDLHDLARRLLAKLTGDRLLELSEEHDGETIIVAGELTPSQTVAFDRTRVIGMATEFGGTTSHTAIVARALGLPAVVGCPGLRSVVSNGTTVILDGERGRVVVDPDDETIEQYQGYIRQAREFVRSLEDLAAKPSITRDGVTIELLGNIEFPDEADQVIQRGGAGIGLYRTEFLYLTGNHEPTEEEQFAAYKRCVEIMAGRPLTIRTFDLGADKYTQLRSAVPERNPFLGLRSIRYCLANLPMFRTQLRAILRASALGPVKIMLPLVTSVHEFRRARYLVRDAMEDLDDMGIPYDSEIKVGIMMEVPSSVLLADAFAREVDFFSIGTNDLIQYTLAVDRTNERVASMYQPTHPAVLKLIRMVVRAARHKKIPVSCCGEAGGDIEFAPLLLGLGVRTLSVTSSGIPLVKRLVRSVTMKQCERLAKQAITFDSELEAAAFLRSRVRKIVPEAFEGRAGED